MSFDDLDDPGLADALRRRAGSTAPHSVDLAHAAVLGRASRIRRRRVTIAGSATMAGLVVGGAVFFSGPGRDDRVRTPADAPAVATLAPATTADLDATSTVPASTVPTSTVPTSTTSTVPTTSASTATTAPSPAPSPTTTATTPGVATVPTVVARPPATTAATPPTPPTTSVQEPPGEVTTTTVDDGGGDDDCLNDDNSGSGSCGADEPRLDGAVPASTVSDDTLDD